MKSKQVIRLVNGNEIDFELCENGETTGLWLNGHDYTEYGEVLDAILKLIGDHEKHKMWMAAEDDFYSARKKDALGEHKKSLERAMEAES